MLEINTMELRDTKKCLR